MANYENIKDANSKRTPSERREIARIAGKASGKARRRKANMRETANRLLTMVGEVEGLSDILRADGGESTYEEIITMAMIQKAAMGDVKAYEALKATVGQTDRSDEDLEEQRIRTDRARRARDQEVEGTGEENENITSFLKAMNPTPEEMETLYDSEEEEEDDAEETETTGDI